MSPGLAPHIWGPAVWSLLEIGGAAADACAMLDPVFVSFMKLMSMYIPCNPCRNFFSQAIMNLSKKPLRQTWGQYVHFLRKNVVYKIAATEQRPLESTCGFPLFIEMERRSDVTRGSMVNVQYLLETLAMILIFNSPTRVSCTEAYDDRPVRLLYTVCDLWDKSSQMSLRGVAHSLRQYLEIAKQDKSLLPYVTDRAISIWALCCSIEHHNSTRCAETTVYRVQQICTRLIQAVDCSVGPALQWAFSKKV